jgi:hypothetical protein
MTYETFSRQQHSYKKMNEIAPAAIGVRKKVRLFQALHANTFTAIIALSQKSRVLLKDVSVLESIVDKMAIYADCHFNHKVLLIDAPLCSKAEAALQKLGWDIQ